MPAGMPVTLWPVPAVTVAMAATVAPPSLLTSAVRGPVAPVAVRSKVTLPVVAGRTGSVETRLVMLPLTPSQGSAGGSGAPGQEARSFWKLLSAPTITGVAPKEIIPPEMVPSKTSAGVSAVAMKKVPFRTEKPPMLLGMVPVRV